MTDQEEKLEKGKLEPPRLPARDTFQSTPNIFEKINKRENIYHNIYGDTNRRWTGILTLLCRWKQSVYSLIWNDVVIFLVIYFFLSLLYRFVLSHYPTHKQTFEILCIYAESFTSSMPITFLLGFYVSQVVSRWWDQFMTLPYPDLLALKLVAFIPGRDGIKKNLRRAIMRYVNLSNLLALRLLAPKLEKRFPTYQSLVEANLLLPREADRLERVASKTPHEVSWTPLMWAMKILARAKSDGKIKIEPPCYANLQGSFEKIESVNRKLLRYAWVNFPLAYTQVANLAVLTYFTAALFSRQYLIPNDKDEFAQGVRGHGTFPDSHIAYSPANPFSKHCPDMIFPFFTIIELICYMGWIQVAESLLNPFGDDDDDFDINYLIDRNLQVSYLIVDQAEEDVDTSQISWDFLEAGPFLPEGRAYWKDRQNEKDGVNGQANANSSPVTIEISSDTLPNSAPED